MDTYTFYHYECEHSGDIARDLDLVRDMAERGGLTVRSTFELVADGPEEGVSLVESSATLKQLRAWAASEETCISGVVAGGSRQSCRDYIRQAEYEFAREEEEEDEW